MLLKKFIFISSIQIILFLIQSCTTPLIKNQQYTINFTQENWTQINTDNIDDDGQIKADFALLNSQTKSIIFLNSSCKKIVTDSLENLIENLIMGIKELKITSKNKLQLYQTSGLKISLDGILNNNPVFLEIITLTKNKCVFDFALIMNNKKIQNDIVSFNKFVSSLNFH